ncbi:MAG: enoyl-CoA hydratase/isomerase family protein, partial [Solirubrobacteraceae bacterium]
MIDVKREGPVLVLQMRAGENRFSLRFLDALNEALDQAEASTEPTALVLTGDGKFFSNGLDLAWMSGEGKDRAGEVVSGMQRVFARVLASPLASVAALNGHAFAGGAMLALACDFRVMRSDRGFFCIPEIDLGLPLSPGMAALIQARLPKLTAHEAIVTGKRYGGEEALARGIVDFAVPEVDLLSKATALAAPLAGKNRAVMQTHK